ncbi:MAG TPA: signal peptidase II [Pseudogracilibacillus sp.]|nr:signal peptidase II [Pseudogracilibacillus sp.]
MFRYYIIALIVIIFDQITKWLIVEKMNVYDSIVIINNFFNITSHRNKGAAWGILQDQMVFFYIITLVVVIGIIYYMQKHGKQSSLLAIGLSLLLGGAIGNFIDRLYRKEVVDFLDFQIFNYNYPIFNIADSALVIGVGLLIIYTILDERKSKKENLL